MEKAIKASDTDLYELAQLLKALADETRLSILVMLKDGERCVCDILEAIPLTQPAISYHLRILRQAGLVKDRRKGKWIYYRLDPEVLQQAEKLLVAAVIQEAAVNLA